MEDILDTYLAEALALNEAGDRPGSLGVLKQILERNADHAAANHVIGMFLLEEGRPETALQHLTRAVSNDSDNGYYWLGVAECMLRMSLIEDLRLVLDAMQARAFEIPRIAELRMELERIEHLRVGARKDLSIASPPSAARVGRAATEPWLLKAQSQVVAGNFRDAERTLNSALKRMPNHFGSLVLLADIARAERRLVQAEKLFCQALALNVSIPEVWNSFGEVLRDLERHAEAMEAFQKAVNLRPAYVEALNNLACELWGIGSVQEAESTWKSVLSINADHVNALINLGCLYVASYRSEEAQTVLEQALKLEPRNPDALHNLGNLFTNRLCYEEAEACYRGVLSIRPNFALAHSCLGLVLAKSGKFEAAEQSFKAALALQPRFAEAHRNYAHLLFTLGMNESAANELHEAMTIEPGDIRPYLPYLFMISHDPAKTPQFIFEEHCRYGAMLDLRAIKKRHTHANARDPGKKLRVGFVSADLCNHAVALFIEPILAAIDSTCFSICAYYNNPMADEVTERFKGYFEEWVDIFGWDDNAVGDKIERDKIDILIDLSGHTDGSRLGVFALKPAPVQVSWIGYPNTTGLKTMDYYIASAGLAPAGDIDDLFVEKIVRLPSSVAYSPPPYAPDVAALPSCKHKVFTFGSFNRPAKITNKTLMLWSEVLHAVPNSRMLLCRFSEAHAKHKILAAFADVGIEQDRLVFHSLLPMHEYLALHAEVDIILDTFPYGGGTTTMHGLWMGVPTLTLVGPTMPSRVGASINSQLGLDDFIAETESEFVASAKRWSNDFEALSQLRSELRARLATSSVCDPVIQARWFENASREIWRIWCSGGQPRSFEVVQ